jgi:hypothetical protein
VVAVEVRVVGCSVVHGKIGGGRRVLLAAASESAPALRPAKGANSTPVVLESKVKGKKKKGSGVGNLPIALDEIRDAQEYLDNDGQFLGSHCQKSIESTSLPVFQHRAADLRGLGINFWTSTTS